MKITDAEHQILVSLCKEYGVDIDKIVRLLDTVQEYKLKDKRHGIYDALEEIIKQKGGVNNEKK